MTKAYLIYLNDTKELYAITDDKTKYKDFLNQHNKQLFHTKKVKMTSDDYIAFACKHKSCVLIDSCLYDGENVMYIIDTVDEEDNLSAASEIITDKMERIQGLFKGTHLDDQHLKIISDATSIINDGNAEIDTFTLFYYLFKYTFVDVSKLDTVKEVNDKFIKEL